MASDGVLETRVGGTLNVVADPITTTRITGTVLDVDGTPLPDVPVSLSRLTVLTDAAGQFTLELPSHLLPTEEFDIAVPTGDIYFDPFSTGEETIDFRRARYDTSTGTSEANPRRHPNLVTSFLDASTVYGSDDDRAQALRTLDGGGKLKTSTGDLLPLNNTDFFPGGPLENDAAGTADPTDMFVAGDVRSSENPALSSLHTVLLREHNRLAEEIAIANPALTGDEIFSRARHQVSALIQHITYDEYLPLLLGPNALSAYTGYDPSLEPGVGAFFTTAAFRFGHSQAQAETERTDASGMPLDPISTQEGFFNTSFILTDGIDSILRGVANQVSEEIDTQIIDELRNTLFGPPGSGGLDLPALSIQRGRDMGLPNYNQARIDLGLAPVTDFSGVTSNVQLQNDLQSTYGTIDKIDAFVGGLAEDHVAGALVGELFHTAIVKQFELTRDSDHFWYENGQFTATELAEIRSTTLSDLIQRNTGVTGLSANAFTTLTAPAGPVPAGTIATNPASEFRSLDGSGNNATNPSWGQTGSHLQIDTSLNYADGISQPNGNDRPGAREVSNGTLGQTITTPSSAGATAMFVFWGQLLAHDLSLTPTGTSDTLKVHGDDHVIAGNSYPFIAEKLELVLEHQVYENVDNLFARPIYLPPLDIANAMTVDPAQQTIVTTPAIPQALLSIAPGSLIDNQGNPFTGDISITEVPRDLTPAALPDNVLPDIVVTIQPGEMAFTTPAPLWLPNRAGYPHGQQMKLMSINPVSGEFDEVGTGQVFGNQIRSTSGGVLNSSWHYFEPDPADIHNDPSGGSKNEQNRCDDCKGKVDTGSYVELHSGAYLEEHQLVGYQSQGQDRNFTLTYDSNRANPSPIFTESYEDVGTTSNRFIATSVKEVTNGAGAVVYQAAEAGSSFQHYWKIPENGNYSNSVQINLSGLQTGSYEAQLQSALVSRVGGQDFGTIDTSALRFEHVNFANSEFGTGWGLAGLLLLTKNGDGSVLLVDGDGSELGFDAPSTTGGLYGSPEGDFTQLVETTGTYAFERTFPDQTVQSFIAHPAIGSTSLLARIRDRNGNETHFEYNGLGQLTKITDPVGLETVFNYTGNKISSISDPGGRTTLLEYNAAGDLTRIEDPDGSVRQFEYDEQHKMIGEVTKRGFQEEVVYGFSGRVTRVTRPDGSTLRFTPVQTEALTEPELTRPVLTETGDFVSDPIAVARPTLPLVNYINTYSQGNGLVQVTLNELLSGTDAGQITTWIDGTGREFVAVVDQAGQIISQSDDEGHAYSVERNEDNLISRYIDGRGFTTLNEYDQFGNVLTTEDDASSIQGMVAEYTFENGLAESSGGPSLSGEGFNSPGPENFTTDIVYGVERPIYTFDYLASSAPRGLTINSGNLIGRENFTVEMVFQVSDVSGRGTIIDITNQSYNFFYGYGIDVIDGRLEYRVGSSSPGSSGPVISPNEYIHFAWTHNDETGVASFYVNGDLAFSFVSNGSFRTGEILSDFLVFFPRNRGLGAPITRVSAGKVALIRLYDNPLRPGQVQNLSFDPWAADFSGPGKTTFTYDPVFNQATGMIDELGREHYFEVDPTNGNLLSVTEVIGLRDSLSSETDDLITSFTYIASGLIDTMTDPLGRVTDYDYDQFERLTKVTYAVGTADEAFETFEYDAAGNVTAVVDELSHRTEFTHDGLNRILQITEPDPDGVAGPLTSPVTQFIYDAYGNEVETIDALNNSTTATFDPLERQTSIRDALNQVTSYHYDDSDNMIARVDNLGRETKYVYDTRNRLVELIDPLAFVEQYEYDLSDNLVRVIDKNGNATEFVPDARNRLVVVTDAEDGVSRYQYDTLNNLTAQSDELGRITRFAYDQIDRLIAQTEPDPDGAGPDATPITTMAYDKASNLRFVTDALNNTTEYRYDERDRLIEQIDPDPDGAGPELNPTMTYVYDDANRLVSVTDPLLRTTTFSYDDLDRLIVETYPDPDKAGPLTSPVMSYTYDAVYNQLSMTDALGNVTEYVYDDIYRLTSIVEEDPDGAGPLDHPITTYTYDAAHQLISVGDPLSRTTSYVYDLDGRVVQVAQPDPDGAGSLAAPVTTYTYDKIDNELTMTDPVGNVTEYEYDRLYRVTRQIDEDLDGPAGPLTNPITTFSYDPVDNLLSLTDPENYVTTYEYDDLDRMITETIELGAGNFKSRSYVYDLVDNLTAHTDRNDRTIEFDYDNLYRMTAERWLDGVGSTIHTIEHEYDIASQMLRAEDVTVGSRYDYTYDDLSRITQTVIANGGPSVVFADAYNANSLRTSMSAQVDGVGDFVTSYEYDGLNRISRIDQQGQAGGNSVAAKRIDFSYNADDQFTTIDRYNDLTGGAGNLVATTSFGYDGIGRLTDLTHDNSTINIVDYDWAFDAATRITQYVNSVDGTSDYSYDNGNQVTDATYDYQSNETYDYDENGNRTNTGYSTGFYNRLTSDGTYNYEYDAEGNRTKRTNIATGEVTEYEWDHRNRLVTITDRVSDGGAATQIVSHRYDSFNRWISKTVDTDGDGVQAGETTHYEYDGSEIVLAIDETGAITNRYLWGPAVDQLLADEQTGSEVLWALTDHLGTIRDLVDNTGVVRNHITFDAFGNVTSETDAAIDELFGYTGRAYEEATGLQNNHHRWYDANVGRWISEDPISFSSGDTNLFRYVENASIVYIDPSGLDTLDDMKKGWRIVKEAVAQIGANGFGPSYDGKMGIGKKAQKIGEDLSDEYGRDVTEAGRHSAWQAMMTWNYGEDVARRQANVHEYFSNDFEDSMRDEINNRIGREIGKDLKDKFPTLKNPDGTVDPGLYDQFMEDLKKAVRKAIDSGRAAVTEEDAMAKLRDMMSPEAIERIRRMFDCM